MASLIPVLIGAPLVLLVIWGLIGATLAHFSGWRKLAQHYGTKPSPMMAWVIGQSASIGRADMSTHLRPGYSDMLNVAVSGGKLYLKPTAFGLFHKALAIPFDDVATAKGSTGKHKTVEIRVAKENDIVITISAALAARIEQLANG